jgi:FkbM family methyltransferase
MQLQELAADPPLSAETVSAETDVGEMLLHAADEVMTPAIRDTGRWEPDEAAWLRGVARAGDTAVDVGANVGYFTLLLSQLVGPRGAVLAVEPERGNLRLLRHNIWRNDAANVHVAPVAAWDARGVLGLRRNPVNAGDHQVHAGPSPDGELVPCIALDEVLADSPVDVLKIDTQGADDRVIAGLARTLARRRGAQALVEFWLDGMADRGIDPAAVLAAYRELDRPLGLLCPGGVVELASDGQILDAAAGWEGRWVNLVIGSR